MNLKRTRHRQIEDYLAYLRQERHLSDNTVSSYGYDLNRLARFAKRERLLVDKLGRRQIESYIRELKDTDKLTPRSVARMIAGLKGFYGFLAEEGQIHRNPSDGIESGNCLLYTSPSPRD